MNRLRRKSGGSTESTSDSIAALYDSTFARVYNSICYRVDDADTAEELTAQVYERAIASLDRYRPAQGPIEAWLFGIVHHLVGDYLRRRRLIAWVSFEALRNHPAPDLLPEEVSLQHSLREHLRRTLPKLKDREQEILGLKYAGGLTNRQIASLPGLTEQNVGVILFRSIEQLRLLMDDRQPGDSAHCKEKEVEHG